MKILIAGNLSYIGPSVIVQLSKKFPNAELIGYDIGYFVDAFKNLNLSSDIQVNKQIYGDIRTISAEAFTGVDVVINLAAISNDAIGNKYEKITVDVNCKAAIRMAKLAKDKGVKSYIFKSSCSMYGMADGDERKEGDPIAPVTTYSRSKVMAEEGLEPLASEDFSITCLRLATVCGWTNFLRIDLVLNDFVAGALAKNEINILSNGYPWRPLIHTTDVGRAVEWSITRNPHISDKFLTVNIGANKQNFQIREMAEAVAKIIPGIKISINPNARPDKRSYRVNFDIFEKLAPDHQPMVGLIPSIIDLKNNLVKIGFNDPNYLKSDFDRLTFLEKLIKSGKLNTDLEVVGHNHSGN